MQHALLRTLWRALGAPHCLSRRLEQPSGRTLSQRMNGPQYTTHCTPLAHYTHHCTPQAPGSCQRIAIGLGAIYLLYCLLSVHGPTAHTGSVRYMHSANGGR